MTELKHIKVAIEAGAAESLPYTSIGLRGRGVLYLHDAHCVQVVGRASRFLRRDAEKFEVALDAAERHLEQKLKGGIIVERAPVCSKARQWLEDRGIEVFQLGAP